MHDWMWKAGRGAGLLAPVAVAHEAADVHVKAARRTASRQRRTAAELPAAGGRQGHLCLGPRPQLARRTPPGAARDPSASPAMGESATGPPHSADGCSKRQHQRQC